MTPAEISATLENAIKTGNPDVIKKLLGSPAVANAEGPSVHKARQRAKAAVAFISKNKGNTNAPALAAEWLAAEKAKDEAAAVTVEKKARERVAKQQAVVEEGAKKASSKPAAATTTPAGGPGAAAKPAGKGKAAQTGSKPPTGPESTSPLKGGGKPGQKPVAKTTKATKPTPTPRADLTAALTQQASVMSPEELLAARLNTIENPRIPQSAADFTTAEQRVRGQLPRPIATPGTERLATERLAAQAAAEAEVAAAERAARIAGRQPRISPTGASRLASERAIGSIAELDAANLARQAAAPRIPLVAAGELAEAQRLGGILGQLPGSIAANPPDLPTIRPEFRVAASRALGGAEGAEFLRPIANLRNAGAGSLAKGAWKVAGKGGTYLTAAELGNQFLVDPVGKKLGADDNTRNIIHRAMEGAALGGTAGSVFAGVGAGPGAILGGLAGAGLGALGVGKPGPKPRELNIQSVIRDNQYLDESSKRSLEAEYNIMVQTGTPAKDALAAVAAKVLPTYQSQQQQRQKLEGIMALQGMAAGYFQPLHQSNIENANFVRGVKDETAQYLPANIRDTYKRQTEIDYGNQMQTANALAAQAYNAPAAFYENRGLDLYDQAAAALTSQAIQGAAAGGIPTPTLAPVGR